MTANPAERARNRESKRREHLAMLACLRLGAPGVRPPRTERFIRLVTIAQGKEMQRALIHHNRGSPFEAVAKLAFVNAAPSVDYSALILIMFS